MALQPRWIELKDAWVRGERDRENDLDLMFHAWMHWADPNFVTGLEEDPDALRIWHQIYEYFGGAQSSDVEFLFASHIMVSLFPFILGDETEWNSAAAALKRRLQAVDASQRLKTGAATRLSIEMFNGRGEYGKYFAHQLRSLSPNKSFERTRQG